MPSSFNMYWFGIQMFGLVHKTKQMNQPFKWTGIQMVDLCVVVKWSGIWMVVWKPDWKKPVYGPKCPVFKWFTNSLDFTIWMPDTHTVQYSD